jgi:hypothetical protein
LGAISIKIHMFKKEELVMWKLKAFRKRVWFKVLNRLERGLIESVIKIVDKVRSTLLTKVLTSIVKKLQTALESPVTRLMREVGRSLAQKISQIAQSWGNKSAQKWKDDNEFVQYLTINRINTPAAFKI